jgi:hypothetical protein
MSRITISLRDQEKIALRTLAEREFRDPRAQAALIIRLELEHLGLLTFERDSKQAKKVKKGTKNV